MAKLRYRSLTERTVDALSGGGRDVIFWDPELPGFGLRIYPSGAKVFLAQGRGPRGSRRVTVGRHGAVSADEARRQAALVLARIGSEEGPDSAPDAKAGAGLTLADLAARYLREHVAARCKPNTARAYRKVIGRHLLPALDEIPIAALGREHVAELHHRLRATPAAANEVISVLSRMLNRAEAWDLLAAGSNPCRFVARFRARRPERFLTGEEFRRLGGALDALEAEGRLPPHPAAALRLLMLTGCRSSEVLTLAWADVHLRARELRLRDSKTGPRVIPLSAPAVTVLKGLPRVPGNPWVIPGRKPGTNLNHLGYYWRQVRQRAGLEDVRVHDLRHSFASRALALGESLSMIGKLLGHSKIQTTARYAHLARDSVKESAARVAASIGTDLG